MISQHSNQDTRSAPECDHGRDIGARASVIAAATLGSRILGFLRDLIIAHALGAGMLADAFFAAFQPPNLMRRLFTEGSLSMSFVPVFCDLRRKDSSERAFAMARSVLAWLVVAVGGLVLAGELFAPVLTRLLAPGFECDPELLGLTVSLVRVCLPYVLLVCGLALCMGVLNSLDHFLGPAVAPILFNACLITSALGALALGLNVALALAWAIVAAGCAQWVLQQFFLARQGFRWHGPWRWQDPGAAATGKRLLPTIFGASACQISLVLATVLATFLPTGAVSSIYYADRLAQFPLGVFGVAISTAALPSLSRLAVPEFRGDFFSALNHSLRLVLFISLPAAAGLAGLSRPIVDLLFGHGAFGPEAVQQTSLALSCFCLGLPAFAGVRTLSAAFFAWRDTRGPVLAALAGLLVFGGTAAFLMIPLGVAGLGLAVSAGAWSNFLGLHILLNRRFGSWQAYIRSALAGIAPSLAMGAAAWASWRFAPQGLKIAVLALIPAWAAAYLAGTRLLGMREPAMLWEAVKRRKA